MQGTLVARFSPTRGGKSCAWVLVLVLATVTPAQDEGPDPPTLSLGLSLASTGDREIPTDLGKRIRGVVVRVPVAWSEVEREPGAYDWTALEQTVELLRRSAARPVLSLGGSHPVHVPSGGPPSPLEGRSLDAWLSFVRGTVRRFAGRVEALEIWDRIRDGDYTIDPSTYAFVLKSSALAARAEARAAGARIRLAQVPVTPEDRQWQLELWGQDVAAYIDILPVSVRVGHADETTGAVLAALQAENVAHPPAAEVWAHIESADPDEPWSAADGAIQALAAGTPVVLVAPVGSDDDRRDVSRWVVGVHARVAAGFAPAPLGQVGFTDAEGRPLAAAVALGAFLDDEFTALVFYRAPGPASEIPTERMLLGVKALRNLRLIDPLTDEVQRVGSTALDSGGRAIQISRRDHPMAVMFQRPAGTAGFELAPIAVETTRERELTAEEIIARYQQVQKVEDDALERWTAKGRIDYHFRFIQGGSTIDISIDTLYFWERGAQLEWEELDYYINGNLSPWKRFPKIPLLQPEKVITLPLDLTLDRTYAYRRIGREKVGGRDAYVLEFFPEDPDSPAALYRGRVWIDATDFYRVKASLVQTELESPVLSNEETDHYDRQVDAAGTEFWLLNKIDGQQVWSTAGRNFVVQRKVMFLDYDLNPAQDAFSARRQQAYDSKNRMMRDTDEGFRYLERQADGTRVPKPPAKSQWLAAIGAFGDSSTGGVQPFGGVNYFNFDVNGKKLQINALIGGVVNFFTASQPDLAGGKLSATVDAFLSGLYFRDQVFFAEDELTALRVDQRTQALSFRLGLQAMQFVRLDFIGGLNYHQYQQNQEGSEAIADYNLAHPGQMLTFVPPPNHTQLNGALQLNFSRRGYSLLATAGVSKRSAWDSFGLYDTAADSFVRYDPSTMQYEPTTASVPEEQFTTWGVTGFKEWFLPKFQKVRAELNYLDGVRLDRFSRYQFSLFGEERLSGFAGTGVRFDRGVVVRAGYSFNLFEVIRFDAAIENAWIRDEDTPGLTQSFAGVGLAGNILGPWKTIISLNYGQAVASDIPELVGKNEFFLLVLKLF